MLERAQAASYDLLDLVRRAGHDRGCPKAKYQTDEMQCDCTVASKYRLVRQTLIDLSKAAEPHEAVCQAVVTGNSEDCDCKPKVVPDAVECMHPDCRMIYRIDPEDAKGDLCANCGNQSVRFVRIEVIR
jgi:hypothetical protein